MALGSDQALNIVVRLKDEASKGFDTLAKKMDGVQKSIAPAAELSKKFALGLAAAGTAAAGFGVMAVKAAAEAQAEMAKTSQTVNNAVETMSVKNLNALQKVADKANGAGADVFDFVIQKTQEAGAAAAKMGFDDEAAANSMANLFQRTGDVNKAMELNKLAMDLAREKGIDLASASNMVGMVMSGNGKVLKQYGIEISDTLTPMEALGELQTKVGGQAAEFSKTFQGQSEALNVAWGNFMELVGEKLLPVLTKLLQEHLIPFVQDTLPKWIEGMSHLNEWVDKNQLLLIVLAGVIAGALTPAIISFGIAAASAFYAMAVAAAPWLIGGAIIGGIVAGVVWIVKNWETVKAKLSEIWAGITGQFKGMINSLIGMGEGWVNGFIDGINGIIKGLNKIKIDMPEWAGGKSFGINIPSVSRVSIPRMEHGGIVPGARGTEVPIIAHGQERVSSAGSSFGGGSVNIQIIITNPVLTGADQERRLKDQIDLAMRDLMRNHKLQPI